MNQAQTWPRGCELDSLNKMAVEACDEKDGVKDGILADPRSCDPFIPLDHVGEAAISCANPSSLISEMAAFVVNATWHGLVDEEGQLLYPGLHPGTDLSGNTTFGIAATTCQDDEDEGCEGEPSALGLWGVQAFGFQNMEADLTQITPDEFYGGLGEAIELVGEYFQSDDPDLSEFRSRGGKFITYHGLVSQRPLSRETEHVTYRGNRAISLSQATPSEVTTTRSQSATTTLRTSTDSSRSQPLATVRGYSTRIQPSTT